MKKKAIILGACVVVFVGALSTQMGHFRAGSDVTSESEKENYEYYYNDEDNSEDTNLSDAEDVSTEENKGAERIKVDTNPNSYAVLVNRDHLISKDYIPEDLTIPEIPFSFYGRYEKSYMRKRAATALENLFAGAKESGYTLKGVSAYRSYERQKQIYNNNVRNRGTKQTDKVSAVPGSSEHQTGLSIDVSTDSVGCAIDATFGKSAEGKWLRKNCYKYGFIIRYPKNKTKITGYSYEPWHIRYVGKNLAKHLYENKITLEEYYQITTVDNQVAADAVQDTDTNAVADKKANTAPTPKPTKKAKATATPTSKPKKTKKPKKTVKPKATKKPTPVPTKKPVVTAAPVETVRPTQAPVTHTPTPTESVSTPTQYPTNSQESGE